jgi:hypothetical protein
MVKDDCSGRGCAGMVKADEVVQDEVPITASNTVG